MVTNLTYLIPCNTLQHDQLSDIYCKWVDHRLLWDFFLCFHVEDSFYYQWIISNYFLFYDIDIIACSTAIVRPCQGSDARFFWSTSCCHQKFNLAFEFGNTLTLLLLATACSFWCVVGLFLSFRRSWSWLINLLFEFFDPSLTAFVLRLTASFRRASDSASSNVSGRFRITCGFNLLLRSDMKQFVLFVSFIPRRLHLRMTFAVTLFLVVEFLSLEKLYAWRGESLSECSY